MAKKENNKKSMDYKMRWEKRKAERNASKPKQRWVEQEIVWLGDGESVTFLGHWTREVYE